MSYYIKECPVCCGMLEIVYDIKENKCSIMCDECSAEWDNPENAISNINGYRESSDEISVRTATLDEVKKMGWGKYIA